MNTGYDSARNVHDRHSRATPRTVDVEKRDAFAVARPARSHRRARQMGQLSLRARTQVIQVKVEHTAAPIGRVGKLLSIRRPGRFQFKRLASGELLWLRVSFPQPDVTERGEGDRISVRRYLRSDDAFHGPERDAGEIAA